MKTVIAFLLAALPLCGQDALSLRDAVQRALQHNPGMHASQAREKAAEERIRAARSGYLPKLNYQEMVQRSNNPVFVFGAKLTQRQFTQADFDIRSLNQPGFVNNFQSMVTVDQVLFDAGRTKYAISGAKVGEQIQQQRTRSEEIEIMQQVAQAYVGAKFGEQALRAAQESVRSATADLERAESFRREGMNTDADVLSIRVHLAAVRQQEIERQMELDVALAALNLAMGESEGNTFTLTTPLAETGYEAKPLAESQQDAMTNRPELAQARSAVEIAKINEKSAKSAYFPEFFVRGVFETDRQELINRGGANWFVGGGLRWNLFNGLRDRAQINESKHNAVAAEAETRKAESGVRFEVRQALLRWKAAKEQLSVANASVDQAVESLRITRDRYENGLSTVTDLLRTETAVLNAKTNFLSALFGQHNAAVALEAARGSLEPGSKLFD